MGLIKVMEPTLANKIAAGEVVERPASVVKELVENSIDAKASKIIIKVSEAGKKEILVSDNGVGMDKDDAILSFARHATSKIHTNRDLFHISTLGFRGEALASIASVSEITLDTATDNGVGTHLELKNGEISNVSQVGCNRGTTIKVRNLFYNTPARLKFLRSDNVEFSHISEVVMKLALSYPHIGFTLYSDEKVSFYSSGNGNILEIISSLYGLEVAKNMNSFEGHNDDFDIHGYTSSLGVSKANKNAIIIILNGRCVRLYSATNGVVDAYQTYLSEDRFPITIVNIDADFSLVDVNVHPSKQEVRLSKENELRELIRTSIRKVFMVNDIAPKVTENNTKSVQSSLTLDELVKPLNQYDNFTRDLTVNETLKVKESNEVYETKTESLKRKRMTPIGQYIAKYILASDGDNFYIIDQHAAAERINYEKFLNKFNDKNNWSYTDLLVPFTFDLSVKEAGILRENLNMFLDLGINIEEFGGNTFKVSTIPTWMKEINLSEYLKEVVEQVVRDYKVNLESLRHYVISTMACKASLKANSVLSMEEMQTLLDTLVQCTNPYTCPHGRPTTIVYSTYELDKLFKRIV